MINLTFQEESWRKVAKEIWTPMLDHWHEVALNQDKIKLAMDYEAYARKEEEGKLATVTARDGSKLAGYATAFIDNHMHYRHTLHGWYDGYYILPEYRNGFNGLKLLGLLEVVCKERKVQKLVAGTKVEHDASTLFERMKWKQAEKLFTKYIGD
jgi:hypothetical protein